MRWFLIALVVLTAAAAFGQLSGGAGTIGASSASGATTTAGTTVPTLRLVMNAHGALSSQEEAVLAAYIHRWRGHPMENSIGDSVRYLSTTNPPITHVVRVDSMWDPWVYTTLHCVLKVFDGREMVVTQTGPCQYLGTMKIPEKHLLTAAQLAVLNRYIAKHGCDQTLKAEILELAGWFPDIIVMGCPEQMLEPKVYYLIYQVVITILNIQVVAEVQPTVAGVTTPVPTPYPVYVTQAVAPSRVQPLSFPETVFYPRMPYQTYQQGPTGFLAYTISLGGGEETTELPCTWPVPPPQPSGALASSR